MLLNQFLLRPCSSCLYKLLGRGGGYERAYDAYKPFCVPPFQIVAGVMIGVSALSLVGAFVWLLKRRMAGGKGNQNGNVFIKMERAENEDRQVCGLCVGLYASGVYVYVGDVNIILHV